MHWESSMTGDYRNTPEGTHGLHVGARDLGVGWVRLQLAKDVLRGGVQLLLVQVHRQRRCANLNTLRSTVT
jgi:hypothetical protein